MERIKSMGASARSFLVFVGVLIVLVCSVSLEMLRVVLVSFSLCRDAQTLSGYLCFSFRFGLWKALIRHAYKDPALMHWAYMHLINHFK